MLGNNQNSNNTDNSNTQNCDNTDHNTTCNDTTDVDNNTTCNDTTDVDNDNDNDDTTTECPSPTPTPTPTPTPAPTPAPYNGGNDGNYWGDPHLVGFDGEKYDVMGEPGKTYNMLSDKDIQYNTTYAKWGDKGATVVDKAGIQVGKSKVEFDRSGDPPTVDGTAMKTGETVSLDKNGSATWDGTKLSVVSPEYKISLSVKDKDNANGSYIDSQVSIADGGPFQDGVSPHGLLGQTADGVKGEHQGVDNTNDPKNGGTVIDGTVGDYEATGLFSNNFKFNRFEG